MPFSAQDRPEGKPPFRVGAPRCSRFALAFIATLVAACLLAGGASAATPANPKSQTTGSNITVTSGSATSLGFGTGAITGYGTETIRATVATTNGTVSVTQSGSASISGSGTATVTVTGTQTDVNNSLNLATLNVAAPIPTQVTLKVETAPQNQTISGRTWTYSSATGHWYSIFDSGSTYTWANAQSTIEAVSFGKSNAYMASSMSSGENTAIATLVSAAGGAAWLGGTDAVTEGAWKWTGRDTNQQFWSGVSNGSAVNGLYTNWGTSEPNDSGGNEDLMNLLLGNGARVTSRNIVVAAGSGKARFLTLLFASANKAPNRVPPVAGWAHPAMTAASNQGEPGAVEAMRAVLVANGAYE